MLKLYGLADYFDAVASGDEVEKPKPQPDVYLLAAKRLGVNPENCLAVEDSVTGMRAAVAAGAECIGYKGTATAKDTDLAECKSIVYDFDEIAELLKL